MTDCYVRNAAALHRHDRTGTSSQGSLPSSPDRPIYALWSEAYKKETGVGLSYQSVGSRGGIRQIQAGTVAFGATDVPLQAADLQRDALVQFSRGRAQAPEWPFDSDPKDKDPGAFGEPGSYWPDG
jgi:PBP superfamily domain